MTAGLCNIKNFYIVLVDVPLLEAYMDLKIHDNIAEEALNSQESILF